MSPIILASASPRRKELLEQIKLSFEIRVSACEEVITKTIPYDIVMELSDQKATDISTHLYHHWCRYHCSLRRSDSWQTILSGKCLRNAATFKRQDSSGLHRSYFNQIYTGQMPQKHFLRKNRCLLLSPHRGRN